MCMHVRGIVHRLRQRRHPSPLTVRETKHITRRHSQPNNIFLITFSLFNNFFSYPEAFFQQHKQEIWEGNEWIPNHTNQLFLNDTYIMAHNLVTEKSTHCMGVGG